MRCGDSRDRLRVRELNLKVYSFLMSTHLTPIRVKRSQGGTSKEKNPADPLGSVHLKVMFNLNEHIKTNVKLVLRKLQKIEEVWQFKNGIVLFLMQNSVTVH